MSTLYIVMNRTTRSGTEFGMYLMNQLFSFFRQKNYGMASYPISDQGQNGVVRSFIARDDTVPGTKVEFLCGDTNSGYLFLPHVAPPHRTGEMHVSITIIQNNALSLCTPYVIMKKLIGPIENMSEAEHNQLIDESIIRLVHQPHMTTNRPFFYRDLNKPLPIVVYANLNFLLPYPHEPLVKEHAAPAKAYPHLSSVEANSIPEILAQAITTVRDELRRSQEARAAARAEHGKVSSTPPYEAMCPRETGDEYRAMIK